MLSPIRFGLLKRYTPSSKYLYFYLLLFVYLQSRFVIFRITHFRPDGIVDRLAYLAVKILRSSFDICSGYALGRIDERGWLNRIVFLETVAGVPGMVDRSFD